MQKLCTWMVSLTLIAFCYISGTVVFMNMRYSRATVTNVMGVLAVKPGLARSTLAMDSGDPEKWALDDKYPIRPEDNWNATQGDCILYRPTAAAYASTGYWQMFNVNNWTVYTISAFYDDRPVLDTSVFVRILVVSSGFKSSEVKPYCQLWYKDRKQPMVIAADVTSSGRGDVFRGVRYLQSLYTCPLQGSSAIPSQVSISLEPCQNSTIYQPIVKPGRSQWQVEFGLCVAISFGTIPIEEFVEWVEFHRLLGVSEINIYDGGMKDMDSVFQYYYDRGVVRVYSMPPPVQEFSKSGIKLSSPASLNDCMMRNMYRYQYIVVVDFDEVIVPKYHNNYTSMLIDINKLHKQDSFAQSYTFRNEYYFKESQQDEKEQLRSMRFRQHAKTSGYLFASKSWVDPRRCLSVFNHYCLVRFSKERKFTVDVDTTLATSRHYRNCNFSKKKCDEYLQTPILDDGILRFRDRLKSRVDRVMTDLGEHR